MALESSTYINGLVATNPTSSDVISDGDNHIRLLKATVKATFPNVTGAVTATHSAINSAVTLANTATNANTASALVKRDGSGNFIAGTVTAALSGNVTGNLTGNVSGNATTATTLATTRNIALSGDVSGNANFNGSGNINLVTAVANDSHTHDTRYFTESEADARFLGINATAASATSATTANHSSYALQWTNARTLSLTGHASGSVTVRGNANMSLNVAVANDSHTHNTLYYTETEMNSLLAGKLGSTATAAAATYAASAGNSNTVDGYSISTSASGSSANTIYFRT